MATRSSHRRWLTQIVALSALSLAVFWGFYTFDHFVEAGRSGETPWQRYYDFDSQSITDAVSSLAGFIAAVFGIVITAVSIIVQLTASRYAVVTRMFIRDPLNVAVMTFYIVACVCGIWLAPALQHDYVPRTLLIAVLTMSTVGLVLMAPYFGYVFWFLEPANIVERIRERASRAVRVDARSVQANEHHGAQAEVLAAMEELTDICSSSISGKDKIIASRAVDRLKDFALDYMRERKGKAPPEWFGIGSAIRDNPDFVAMDSESLAELEQRRTWVEWKVMRQYLGIYNEALASMRDINYLIAIDTRYIGEEATRRGDGELVDLVYRYMNSYLRATLNARDVRTAYNVFNQYRLLLENMLRNGRGAAVLPGLRHLKYYANISFDMKLTFVTETVAYDISTLVEVANSLEAPEEEAMLEEFLDLDRPLVARSQEKGLLGVRKAQVKLGCYYLSQGNEAKARMIADDMREEPHERLVAVRYQLERVQSKDFWEIIDRGRNFEFMPDHQRQHMDQFFGWLRVERVSSLPGEPQARAAKAGAAQ